MVDQLRLSGCARDFRQLLLPNQHIDQGRLSHVGPANKSEFRPVGLGTFGMIRTRYQVCGGMNIHDVASGRLSFQPQRKADLLK
jgi:hypothetical protein